MTWYVYVLRCADNSLYTGIAKDVPRRVDEHNRGYPDGAKYTTGRRPVSLVYTEAAIDRAQAARRECEIKALDREQKLLLITRGAV